MGPKESAKLPAPCFPTKENLPLGPGRTIGSAHKGRKRPRGLGRLGRLGGMGWLGRGKSRLHSPGYSGSQGSEDQGKGVRS